MHDEAGSGARRNAWTPEAIQRFWDRYAGDPRNVDNYFAKKFGTAIVNVLRTATRDSCVLDLGCGPGFLSERLLAAGYTVQGIDQSPGSVAAANTRCAGSDRWRGASTDAAVVDGDSFDAVTCIETIEHLDDAALGEVFSEIRRLLIVGGVALFTTPNEEDLAASMVYCPFCDSEFHEVQHVRSWSGRTLASALEQAGFEIRTCAATNLAWWMPFRESQWLGVRRSTSDLIERARHRTDRWGDGPHLIALATSR